MTKLFVYGILQEEAGGFFGRTEGCEFICRANTHKGYDLLRLGGIAGLVGGQNQVRGELWSVDDATLAHCDAIEGHPHHYRRMLVRVIGDELEGAGHFEGAVEAYVYLHGNPDTPRYEADENGVVSWLKRREL